MTPSSRRRSLLAAAWTAFVALWVASAFFSLALTALGPCGGDGGSPYAAPASPAGRYCESVSAYFEAGEPSEVTTALLYLWPVAALLAIGGWGVWTGRARTLAVVAALASAVLVVHVVLSFSLRDRCAPDDPTAPGCAHY